MENDAYASEQSMPILQHQPSLAQVDETGIGAAA